MERKTMFRVLAAIWIGAVMALFYVRFTIAFFIANRDAIAALAHRLTG